jgi:hypothetical protein
MLRLLKDFTLSEVLIFVLSLVLGSLIAYYLSKTWYEYWKDIKDKMIPEKELDKQARRKFEQIYKDVTYQEGPKLLGCFETLFTVISVITYPLLIIGWLTFKVATKWETWKNIVDVQSNIDEETSKPFLNFYFRFLWGGKVMQQFWIGTMINIFAGIIGGGITMLIFISVTNLFECI